MQRPVGVSVIAVLYFIAAFCLVVCGVGVLAGTGMVSHLGIAQIPPRWAPMIAAFGAFIGIVLLLLGGLAGFVGTGLWTMKNWARLTTIVLSAIGIVFALPGLMFLMMPAHGFHFIFGPVALVWLLIRIGINAVIIWYLLQPEVARLFAASA